jgi:ELWxxDGT repeat protein
MRSVLVAILSLATTSSLLAPAHAAPPTLLADLNPAIGPRSSAPGRIGWISGSVVPDDFVLIRSSATSLPLTVWITDGTDAGTVQVTGLPTAFLPQQATPLTAARTAAGGGGAIVLSLNRPNIGTALYGLDPVTAHATLLLEGSGLGGLLPVGDRFIFTYDDGVHGRELWSSNGTPAGTSMLLDLSPGVADTSVSILNSNGAAAWVSIKPSGAATRQLYITDGTVDNTHPLGPISPTAPDAGTLSSAIVTGGLVYAARDTGASQTRIYFATTTAAPAAAIGSTSGAIALGNPPLVSTGTHALLVGADTGTTQHIFVTDGAQATAISESPLFFGSDLAVVADASAPLGWIAYFPGGASSGNTEPCRTDGTRAGTGQIVDLNPGADPSTPFRFTGAGTRAYFGTLSYVTESAQYNGTFLSTDGSPQGTIDLGMLPGAPANGAPIAPIAGQLLCSGSDSRGQELWRFDPATNTFSFVRDLFPGDGTSSSPLIVSIDGGSALLNATTPSRPQQVFVTDGTPAGTLPAMGAGFPLMTSFFTCPTPLGSIGGQFATFANNGPSGDEPWLVNRTTGAATIIRDIRTASSGSQPGASFFTTSSISSCFGSFTSANVSSVASGNRTVFAAAPAAIGPTGYAVWSTDGTTPNTVELTRHRLETGFPTLLFNFTTLGSRAFFLAPPLQSEFSQFDTDLWVTDGTVAGTQRAVPLRPLGMISTPPTQLTAFNGRLYFTGSPTGINRLYSSDGTPANTALANIGPEAGALPIGFIYPTSLGLVYSTTASDGRASLWITDNSPAGTRRLTPDTPDSRYANLGAIRDGNARIYFAMWTRDSGRELWSTDGTAAGTHLVADINPGPASSDPTFLRIVSGDRLIFSAFAPASGIELWQSDGTAYGTRLIADLNPGPASSGPVNAAQLGPTLIFGADDGSTIGRELWTTTLTPACRCDIDNSGASSIQDIFDYLKLYFTGDGDINADGQTTVQDIFDFLACWFGGCE